MDWKGHLGLSLLISSLLMIPFGLNIISLIFILIIVLFSTLPDTDLLTPLEHRTLTHNVGFGLIFAAIFGSVSGFLVGTLFSTELGILFGAMVFLAVIGAVLSHLLGDMIAGLRFDGSPWKIKPVKPFSGKSVGYGVFLATDERVNNIFIKVGILTFSFYVTFGIFLHYSGLYETWEFIPALG